MPERPGIYLMPIAEENKKIAAPAGVETWAVKPQLAKQGPEHDLVFAFAGTGVIVFECLLSLRKKYPASPIGRVTQLCC